MKKLSKKESLNELLKNLKSIQSIRNKFFYRKFENIYKSFFSNFLNLRDSSVSINFRIKINNYSIATVILFHFNDNLLD